VHEQDLGIGRDARLLAILERLLEIEDLDLPGALGHACDLVGRALSADKSCAFLLDTSIRALVAVGISDTPMGRRERSIGMDRLPLANGGPTVEVYRTGVPRVTGSAEADPIELLGFTHGLGVRSIVECPLAIGGERRGVLAAMSADADRFDGEDLRFLVAVARFVGLVAHRTELSEAVVAAAAEGTRRAATEQALLFQAFHDPLTGLPNRALFMDRFGHAVARMTRREDLIAVLFLDVDRFKNINDSLGHDVGDQVLAGIAERLHRVLRPEDTAARLGGDEFVVLLEDIGEESDAVRITERILAEFDAPFRLDAGEVRASASVGIALGESRRERPTDLLRNADIAMYRAKQRGGAGYNVYDMSTGVRVSRRLELEHELSRALERGEFVLHYQPKVDLTSGRIVGVEALIRWAHPERGLLAPAEFIYLAENSGLIVPLGRWVLAATCAQAAAWRASLGDDGAPRVSANVSSRQFQQRRQFVGDVARALSETGLPPRLLELELTEGVLAERSSGMEATLSELRALGVRVAIDDFGSGYASLSYLKRCQVDVLKIDRSFVGGLGGDERDEAIVRAAILLATALGEEVQAEGIETPKQLGRLQVLGCGVGQGYLFDQPLPRDEASEALARGSYALPTS